MRFKLTLLFLVSVVLMVLPSCGEGVVETGVPDLVQGRWNHTATLLNDGSILVVGGEGKFRTGLDSTELFKNQAWSSAGATNEQRGEGHTATLLDDGRVLVVGGSDTSEIYDPSSGSWTATGSMDKPRKWHSSVRLEDGRVLVAGGEHPTNRKAYNLAEVYDPSTGEWSVTDSLEETHTRDKAILLNDGTVLIAGEKLSEIYDPSTGEWSSAGALLKQRKGGYTFVKLQNGNGFVTGGETLRGRSSDGNPIDPNTVGGVMASHDAFLVGTPKVDIYDIVTGKWVKASNMLEVRKIHPGVLLADGRYLVFGALNAETYDVLQDQWTLNGVLMKERGYGFTATLMEDGKVLVVGGNEGYDPFLPATNKDMVGIAKVEIYDPDAVPE